MCGRTVLLDTTWSREEKWQSMTGEYLHFNIAFHDHVEQAVVTTSSFCEGRQGAKVQSNGTANQ